MTGQCLSVLAAVFLLLLCAGHAEAACSDPAGEEGHIIYNADYDAPQFCDGDIWWGMKQGGGLPTCSEGDTIVMASAGWGCGSAGGGLAGPSGCANIGDLCADGTVFAGYHPILHDHLFIPTADQEQPGSPGTFTMNWKNATGTDDINPDSTDDGQLNHANRGGNIADFQAFQACEDLGAGGHADWYLPSLVELFYLWSVHEEIEAGGNITNFIGVYWASSELNTTAGRNTAFNLGTTSNATKTNANRVRCIRR